MKAFSSSISSGEYRGNATPDLIENEKVYVKQRQLLHWHCFNKQALKVDTFKPALVLLHESFFVL